MARSREPPACQVRLLKGNCGAKDGLDVQMPGIRKRRGGLEDAPEMCVRQ